MIRKNTYVEMRNLRIRKNSSSAGYYINIIVKNTPEIVDAAI